MRSDLAALTPPLVMAVAFIAGVIALLRREMSPRRRGRITQLDENDPSAGPYGTETTSAGYAPMPGDEQNSTGKPSDNNSGNSRVAGCGAQDLPEGADHDVINPASEDHRPASHEA
ncbi:MAG TPA: hypothetical protein VLW50_16575 [Streptosporangiaceae bacterium]|nr:hypothetical protein [Streptosporangiaceae bacterium]